MVFEISLLSVYCYSPNPMELNLFMNIQILLTDLHMHNTQFTAFLTLAHTSAPLMFKFI